jgi:hypothetical protein
VKLKEVYEKLNINFDVFWGESQVETKSMERALDIVQKKNLTCEDDGALLVDLVKFKMDRAIVRKRGKLFVFLASISSLLQMEQQFTSPEILVAPTTSTRNTSLTSTFMSSSRLRHYTSTNCSRHSN